MIETITFAILAGIGLVPWWTIIVIVGFFVLRLFLYAILAHAYFEDDGGLFDN